MPKVTETPIVDQIKNIIADYFQNEGRIALDEMIEARVEGALEEQVPLLIVSELHRQLGSGAKPNKVAPAGRKHRPRCKKCDRAMRKGADGYECHNCLKAQEAEG